MKSFISGLNHLVHVPQICLKSSPFDSNLCCRFGDFTPKTRHGKGVIFLTLEDETGYANIIIWRKVYEKNRRAIISGRLLRITGKLQHEGDTTHVIAKKLKIFQTFWTN